MLALALFFTQPKSLMAQYLVARGKPQALAVAQLAFGLVDLAATAILLVGVGRMDGTAYRPLCSKGWSRSTSCGLLARDGVAYGSLAASWIREPRRGDDPGSDHPRPGSVLGHNSDSLIGVLAVCAVWAVAFAPAAW